VRYKILVIDDEWNDPERKAGYRSFERISRLQSSAFGLDLDFLRHPLELNATLQSNRYSALLIDVKLTNWSGHTLPEIIELVGDTIPIALVSEYWDDTNSEEVNAAWAKPNCKTFFQWKEIAAEKGAGISRAIFHMSKIIAEGAKLDMALKMKDDDPIYLLHISDLQIGGFDLKRVRLEAQHSAEEVLKHCKGVTPTFVAFTGDVAETGLPIQFEQAIDWLKHFLEPLGFPPLPSERFFLIPGNHDVCVPLAAARRIKLQKSKSKGSRKLPKLILNNTSEAAHRELSSFAYRPYLDFNKLVTSVAPHASFSTGSGTVPCWIESRFRHFGISFYGVNTTQPINDQGWPERKVSPDDLAIIGKSLRKALEDRSGKTVVVGLGHHSPMSEHEDRSVVNPEDFNTFFSGELKTSIFLHGHIHERKIDYHSPGRFRLVRSCASTLTKEGPARPSDSFARIFVV
jgi:hypothetical protein